MKINFKQPKYMLPLILLPFLCLFFYVYKSIFRPKARVRETAGLNSSVGKVSSGIQKKRLADKLDAYRDTYKNADGITTVGTIPGEEVPGPSLEGGFRVRDSRSLDSLHAVMRERFGTGSHSSPAANPGTASAEGAQAIREFGDLSRGRSRSQLPPPAAVKDKDPIEIFRQQMAVMDSISKQHDPAVKEESRKKAAAEKAAKLRESQVKLIVRKADTLTGDFNTVLPDSSPSLISAEIDENVTGYAGSRLRLKLLEDIRAGSISIAKGTPLFAQVTGFSQQRVTLSVSTILYNGKILPVRLEIYDLDGLPGLYVPSSAFRDFSKDLGGNAVQGVNIDGGSGNSQFIMSSLDKVFQSTSSAIANLVRKNKAKLKYSSFLYLIDPDALQNSQKTY